MTNAKEFEEIKRISRSEEIESADSVFLLKMVKNWFDEDNELTIAIIKALDMAIETLEKQIPKKPTEYTDNSFVRKMSCANCNRHFGIVGDVIIPTNSKYCPECGQAIDWEADNDD